MRQVHLYPCNDRRNDLPAVIELLISIPAAVGGHSVDRQPQPGAGVQSPRKVVRLRHQERAAYSEDIAGAVEAVVRPEARVIADDILLRHSLPYRFLTHLGGLVVPHPAVVAGHQQLPDLARAVERDARGYAVPKHRSCRAEHDGHRGAGRGLHGIYTALPTARLRLDKRASAQDRYGRKEERANGAFPPAAGPCGARNRRRAAGTVAIGGVFQVEFAKECHGFRRNCHYV